MFIGKFKSTELFSTNSPKINTRKETDYFLSGLTIVKMCMCEYFDLYQTNNFSYCMFVRMYETTVVAGSVVGYQRDSKGGFHNGKHKQKIEWYIAELNVCPYV